MQEHLQARLGELHQEYELGQARLRELQAEQSRITETLLRLEGAMLVVREVLEATPPQPQNGADADEPQSVSVARA